MTSFNIHKITSFINDYLNSHLNDFFNEPYHIMLLDEHKELVLKWSDQNGEHLLIDEDSAVKTIRNLKQSKQIKDISFGCIPFTLGKNAEYYLSIHIKGDIQKADAYLILIKELLKESVQAHLNQQVINKNEQFTFAIMNSIHFVNLPQIVYHL